jgi:hypothetical protein
MPRLGYFYRFKHNLRMKFFVLTTAFALFATWLPAQTETFDLDDWETLLTRLFDADTLNDEGEALWEPLTFADEITSPLSDDGWVHTRLDTILFYEIYGMKRAVAVFETLRYQSGRVSACPVCGALLSVAILDQMAEDRWKIHKFSKHFTTLGSGGYGGEVGIARFGEQQWCLALGMSWEGQGIYAEYLSFLNLDDLEKVFNLTVHEDNQGVLGEDSDRVYSFDKALHLLPSIETVTGWWEFDVVTQGTQPDDDVQRSVPANTVERYTFSWGTGTYMKVCR